MSYAEPPEKLNPTQVAEILKNIGAAPTNKSTGTIRVNPGSTEHALEDTDKDRLYLEKITANPTLYYKNSFTEIPFNNQKEMSNLYARFPCFARKLAQAIKTEAAIALIVPTKTTHIIPTNLQRDIFTYSPSSKLTFGAGTSGKNNKSNVMLSLQKLIKDNKPGEFLTAYTTWCAQGDHGKSNRNNRDMLMLERNRLSLPFLTGKSKDLGKRLETAIGYNE